MSKTYSHLTLKERIQIEKYRDKGYSITAIGVLLNRSKSTISREIQKCPTLVYSAHEGNLDYLYCLQNKNYGRSKIKSNPILLKFIHAKLKKKWSPEQISISLKNHFPNDKSMQASHDPRTCSNCAKQDYLFLHLSAQQKITKRRTHQSASPEKKNKRRTSK